MSRPCSGTGVRSNANLRSVPPRGAPSRGAKGKAKAKPASLEEQRRARILHMQKLYGLGGADGPEEEAASTGPAAAPAEAQITPDVDRALRELRASMDSCEAAQTTTEAPAAFVASWRRDATEWPLPSLPEDPLNTTSMSMGSSGGLIAWSKNLQAEEASPQATLASFFKPQF